MKLNKPHDTQRGYFAFYLYEMMQEHKDIVLITCDLGYKLFDPIREDFPDRFINVGASEQTALDIAVGMALSGKVPYVYSITPFLLWRPAEAIRIYLDHEGIPVKLIGGGRNEDYVEDGFTHSASDVWKLISMFRNIISFFPVEKWDIRTILKESYTNGRPTFISLKR